MYWNFFIKGNMKKNIVIVYGCKENLERIKIIVCSYKVFKREIL